MNMATSKLSILVSATLFRVRVLIPPKHSLHNAEAQLTQLLSYSPKIRTALKQTCGQCKYTIRDCYMHQKQASNGILCFRGVITYALLVGKLPFTVEPFRIPKLCRKMLMGDMNPIPSHLSGNCRYDNYFYCEPPYFYNRL